MEDRFVKTHLLCLVCLLFTPFGTQKPSPDGELDFAAIEKSLSDFSAALAASDTASLRRLAGPTFVLLEEGRTFDFQSMILSIEQVFATGAKMKRVPSDFQTEIRGSVAWSNYRVAGEFENNRGKVSLSLLEAAVLERDGKQWRIVQMTTMPAADQ
jgi:SnoaL-like domain